MASCVGRGGDTRTLLVVLGIKDLVVIILLLAVGFRSREVEDVSGDTFAAGSFDSVEITPTIVFSICTSTSAGMKGVFLSRSMRKRNDVTENAAVAKSF